MFVINIVVTHIDVDHAVMYVCPDHGVIAAVPDLIRLGACSKREACRIYR
jgi:hypothetical protein